MLLHRRFVVRLFQACLAVLVASASPAATTATFTVDQRTLWVPTPGDGPRPMRSDARYRSAMEVAISPDDKTLYVSDFTMGSIVVMDAATGERQKEIHLPGQPVGLAVSKDGRTLYVADYGRCKVLAVDVAAGTVAREVIVGRRPFGIALAPKANRLYACNLYTNDVSVVEAAAMKEVSRIPVVREPRFVAITPDESKAIVSSSLPTGPTTARDVAIDVSILDLRANTVDATLRMVVGASNGRGVAVSPDGRWGYVASMRALFNAPVTQIERGWELTGVVNIIDMIKNKHYATVILDSALEGAPNPYGIATSPDGTCVYVSLASTAQVIEVDIEGLLSRRPKRLQKPVHERDEKPARARAATELGDPEFLQRNLGQLARYGLARRLEVDGNGPRGLCVSSDGKRLYVANYYTGNVACLDTTTGRAIFSKAIGPQPKANAVRRGEMFFNDALHGFEKWASCASCHPEGRADGLNWDLINDGVGNPKETKSHLYAEWTPPVMARGVRASSEAAIRAGFKWIQFCQVPENRIADIREYLKSLRPEPSPYLTADGKLTESARRGKKIFEEEAVCGTCHRGKYFTDLKAYDVGTRDPQFNNPDGVFDTPTLVEIWRTGPYLHDGRAVTIEEVFTTFNTNDKHGVTSHLTEQQIRDLCAYMLSIGTEQPAPPHPEPKERRSGTSTRSALLRSERGVASRPNPVTPSLIPPRGVGERGGTIERAESAFLETSRRKFEEARQHAATLPGQIEPLLRAGRYDEAAEAARNAAAPFAQIDAVELFFERWWVSAELMVALEKKTGEAIASGTFRGEETKTGGRPRLPRSRLPPQNLCELAAKVADAQSNWDMVALGLLYLYRGRSGEQAMGCFRAAEDRGWNCSWFMERVRENSPGTTVPAPPAAQTWPVSSGSPVTAGEGPNTIIFVQAEIMTGSSRLQVSNHRHRHALKHHNKQAGWRIVSLSPPRPDGTLTVLTPEFAGAMEPCLSFDAKKIVFVGSETEKDTWDVWEMDSDGGNKRKVIGDMGPYCCSPAYLPDGRIIFSATKWASRMKPSPSIFPPGYGHEFTVFKDEYDGDFVRVLTRCDPDGSNPEQVTFNASSDFQPWVMDDGRLLFTSYQHHGHHNGIGGQTMLALMNPDGTGFIDLAGNRVNKMFRTHRNTETARQFPDGRIVACGGFESHGAQGGGWLLHCEPSDPDHTLRNLTPSVMEWSTRSPNPDKDGAYISPYPFQDGSGRMLVGYGQCRNKPTTNYGIYWFDWRKKAAGELVYDDPKRADFWPIPVEPRPLPLVIPDHVLYEKALPAVVSGAGTTPEQDVVTAPKGTLHCLNVYRTSPTDHLVFKPGQVKKVRVLEGFGVLPGDTISTPHPPAGLDSSSYGANIYSANNFEPKIIVGEAPVAEDGSFFIEVPADKVLSLQVLNDAGMNLAEALTWIWVRPGENRGCVGCHENRTEVPDFDFMPEAPRKPPTRMGILAKDRLALDFRKDIMPIIEAKCVSCHSATKRAGSLDLSGGLELVFHYKGVNNWSYHPYNAAFFNRAYESLMAAGRIPEPTYGSVRQFQQGAYVAPGYAARSPLIWRLTGIRYDGKTLLPKDKIRTCPPPTSPQLTEAEKYRFIQWVDLGCQFSNIIGMGDLPGWQPHRAQAMTQAYYDKLARPIEPKHLARDVSERCMLCHRQKVRDMDPEWKRSLMWKTKTDGLAAWTQMVETMRAKKVGMDWYDVRYGKAATSVGQWIKPGEVRLVAAFLDAARKRPGDLPIQPGVPLVIESPKEQDAHLWISTRQRSIATFLLNLNGDVVWNHDLPCGFVGERGVGVHLKKGTNTFRFECKDRPSTAFKFRLTEMCEGAYYPRFLARGLDVKIAGQR